MKTMKKETKGRNSRLRSGKQFVNMLALLPFLGMQSDLMAAKNKPTRSPMSQQQQAAYQTVVATGINCNAEDSNSLQVQQALLQAYIAHFAYTSLNGLSFNKNVTIGTGNSFATDGDYYAHTEAVTTIDAQGSITGVTTFFDLTVTPDSGTSVAIVGDVVIYGDLTLAANTTLTIDGSLVLHGALNLGANASLELITTTAQTDGSLYLLADSCVTEPVTFGTGSSLTVIGNFVDYRSEALTIPSGVTFSVGGQTWTKGDMYVDGTTTTFTGKVNVPNGSLYVDANATFAAGISAKNGVFVKAGVTATVSTGGLTVTGTGLTGDVVSVGSGATLTVTVGGIGVTSGNVDVTAGTLNVAAGGLAITKGDLDFSGASTSSITGGILLDAGNLSLSGTSSLTVPTVGLSVTTGNVSVGAGTTLVVTLGGIDVTSGAVTVANGANEFTVTTGGVTVTSGSFTVGTGVTPFVIGGVIAGDADVTINSAPTAGTITTITAKTLTTSVNVTASTGISTSGSVTVTAGTLTATAGGIAIDQGDLTVSGAGTVVITAGGLGITTAGNVSLSGTSSLTVTNTGIVLIAGNLSVGAGTTLVVTAGGIDVTTGDVTAATGSNFTVTIDGVAVGTGALNIDSGLATFALTGDITGGANIVLDTANTGAYGAITGAGLSIGAITVTSGGAVALTGGSVSIAVGGTLAMTTHAFGYNGNDVVGTSFTNAGSLTATTGNISIENANNNAGVAVTAGTITTTTGTIAISGNVSTSGDYGVDVNGTISSAATQTAANLTFADNQGSVGVYFEATGAVNVGGTATFDSNSGAGDSATNVAVYFAPSATFNVYRGSALPGTAIVNIALPNSLTANAFNSSNITLFGNAGATALTFTNGDFGATVGGVAKPNYSALTASSPDSAMITANQA